MSAVMYISSMSYHLLCSPPDLGCGGTAARFPAKSNQVAQIAKGAVDPFRGCQAQTDFTADFIDVKMLQMP